jgi:DNA modification methylase
MSYQLYLGDCLEFMRGLKAGEVDAVVTDPPYGIGEDGGDKQRRRHYKPLVIHEKKEWDKARPTKQFFDEIRRVSKVQIIWGGNYFADYLPPSMGWLYLYKNIGGDFSDGELAWTSQRKAVRDFSKSSFAGLHGGWDRQHPTQKPVSLMAWCISLLPPECTTIFDPFAGSGTTGVACMQTGRNFIGCEIDPQYYAIAERRIKDAAAQPLLFEQDEIQPHKQGGLFDA